MSEERESEIGYSPSEGFRLLIDMALHDPELEKLLLKNPRKVLKEGYQGTTFTSDMLQLEKDALSKHTSGDLEELTRFVLEFVLFHD